MWQLAVLPALQSRGLGTLLIRAAEQRIRNRGLRRAELAVEESNPRARALYERLGYASLPMPRYLTVNPEALASLVRLDKPGNCEMVGMKVTG